MWHDKAGKTKEKKLATVIHQLLLCLERGLALLLLALQLLDELLVRFLRGTK